ncbi:MAG TPA: M24 family metallopeptidase, partial [Terriglobales bacterium]|nr:M24 family metallopeptidase [Terriglobales bacterium]
LKERNLADAKIGLIDTGRGLPLPQLEALRSLLPRVHWQSCDRMLQQMRLKKSGRELAVLRKGARVLQRIFQEAEAIIQTGRKECEMVAELDRLARHKGVEDVRLLVGKERLQPPGSGPDTLQGHWAVYLSIQYGRYWVEAGRSFNLDSDPGFEQAYGKARDSLEAMSANIRPGQSLKTVDDGVRRCLGDLHATAAAYGLGNGIGLSPWEAPFLDQEEGPNTISSNAQTLECDMTLTLRVGIAPERNLALFGDSYHVTARGLIPLSESMS